MDKLLMSVIKNALPVILPVLTELINRSIFPSAWKESVVIPILKEGDHEVADNSGQYLCYPLRLRSVNEQLSISQQRIQHVRTV